MASSMSLKLACVLVLCLAVASPQAQGAITCGQVISYLAPCIVYVRNNGAGGGVPATCCMCGLNSPYKISPSTDCKSVK
ncbi:Detected protein of unknown function [Hibiscus syriacus]|uniref:Non-specific lipid-transfer protein n=1 Tax=Hibiscus syriacus TaxID=106335 RepID=A0A6A2ZME8_HIBSY|nr:Detected protein of unknown function [Hibiscus syriacus]